MPLWILDQPVLEECLLFNLMHAINSQEPVAKHHLFLNLHCCVGNLADTTCNLTNWGCVQRSGTVGLLLLLLLRVPSGTLA